MRGLHHHLLSLESGSAGGASPRYQGRMSYVIISANGVTSQSRERCHQPVSQTGDHCCTLGLMCISGNTCMCALPPDTMKSVVRTKSAASLPNSLCVVTLLNGLLWVIFGFDGEYFELTLSAIGSALSAAQVAIYSLQHIRVLPGGGTAPGCCSGTEAVSKTSHDRRAPMAV
ncbi:Sugar efflux transporter for intercellular exchange [Phytophthora infestans]|uniref:Sugar efflux transporter for intercellular exchange n=2 Tax=Phytophthora infestans TaxID=4787 RepID=A0A8S9U7K2_PHYIN|nr:Sugar efflux transporter for intercellular exchange [Phytophthora infestans]